MACGLVRTVPQPSPEVIDRYYPAGYYGMDQRYPGPLEWLLDRLYSWRAGRLEKASGVRWGRALDIGCGRGNLLAHLRRRGWTVTGTELNEVGARYAREVLHLDVRTGDISGLQVEEPYDLVILWHVLEHIPDPAELITVVAGLMRPGATLLIAVPNFDSVEARISRAHWFHLDVPRHLNHLGPEVLRRLLRNSGLEPYTAEYFAPEYDFFSFVQTALNTLGIQHNLLYDFLRTRGAKVLAHQSRLTSLHVVLILLLTPVLALLSLLWIPFSVKRKQSATIAIYARRSAV
jgi:SAM-dependent methyltransferase